MLLGIGGFFAGVGWLVGASLLWTSTRWSTAQKVLGTVAPPGGLAAAVLAIFLTVSAQSCATAYGANHEVLQHQCTSSGVGTGAATAIVISLAVLCLATLSYLGLALRRATSGGLEP